MMGPRTLEGGYSPSQYMSSAMFSETLDSTVGTKAVLVLELTSAVGIKADVMTTKTARITKLNLDMMEN
jgi:hypothetical protein